MFQGNFRHEIPWYLQHQRVHARFRISSRERVPPCENCNPMQDWWSDGNPKSKETMHAKQNICIWYGIRNKWATLHGEKLKHPKDWHTWSAKHQPGPSHLPLNITEDWGMEYNVAIACDHRKRYNKAASACCMYMNACNRLVPQNASLTSIQEIRNQIKLKTCITLSYTLQSKLYRTAC